MIIVDPSVSDETERSLIWLKNNKEPYTEVVEHWENTRNFRKVFLEKDVSLTTIFTKFPILKEPFGLSLVCISSDFLQIMKLFFSSWVRILNTLFLERQFYFTKNGNLCGQN